jgi:hypothetical protein
MAQRSIAEKADTVATFRYLSVYLMETLARWTPLTPELEVKILFGRHLWEFAQHADALGQRAAELRAGLHYTRPPVAPYRQVLDQCASFETASDRVHSVYDVLVPDLERRYRACLKDSDALLDQPSIRILDRVVQDFSRLQTERREMLAEAVLPSEPPEWIEHLQGRLAAHSEFVDYRPSKEAKS